MPRGIISPTERSPFIIGAFLGGLVRHEALHIPLHAYFVPARVGRSMGGSFLTGARGGRAPGIRMQSDGVQTQTGD